MTKKRSVEIITRSPSQRVRRGSRATIKAQTRYKIEDQILEFFKKCKGDFPFFTKKSLKIRDKEGKIVPLVLNEAQLLIHEKLEAQKKRTGRVRAVILKGRQQGCSTLVQARFMWHLLHSKGIRAFILTHLSDSTQALFSMAKRYLEHLPAYKPTLGKCNQNEVIFSEVDCSLKVGTAGSTGVGRGETLQLVHGSEAAFWPNSEEHFAGILQAVPSSPGTEIILESTANQMGNVFYRMVMEASTDNTWQLIFLPWYLQPEYATPVSTPLTLSEKEIYLRDKHSLTSSQLLWRRNKIKELGDERKFNQEYPTVPTDAFITDSETSFITTIEVAKANHPEDPIPTDKEAPLIIGIDPSGKGKDDSAYAIRCGRILERTGIFPKREDTMELVGDIERLIHQYKPDHIFIDSGGLGSPIYDRLKEKGHRNLEAINFGSRAEDPEQYANKRAEMFDRMKRWFNDPPCQIPNDPDLKMELSLTEWATNSSGKLQLAPKKNLIKSPNLADAFALTFSRFIPSNSTQSLISQPHATLAWNPYDASSSF